MNLKEAVEDKIISLHNIEEIVYLEEYKGYALQRFPTKMLNEVNFPENYSKINSYYNSTGCEIRCCTTSSNEMEISVNTSDSVCEIMVFLNNRQHSKWYAFKEKTSIIRLNMVEEYKNLKEKNEFYWRIIFGKNSKAIIQDINIDKKYCIPYKNSRNLWIAYGSSISHGSGAYFITQSYIHYTAQMLGYDVLNKAVSGISFLEPAVAEYLRSIVSDCVVSLELGLNMIGRYSIEIFESRVRNLLDKIIESKPRKVIVISPILCKYCIEGNSKRDLWKQYRNKLQEICEDSYKNIKFIDGADLIGDFSNLNADLLHPSGYGHYLMGSRLLNKLDKEKDK